jgi:hypothetical protein
MLRRAPTPTSSTTPDWELGIAAVLLLLAVVLTAVLVPTFA